MEKKIPKKILVQPFFGGGDHPSRQWIMNGTEDELITGIHQIEHDKYLLPFLNKKRHVVT